MRVFIIAGQRIVARTLDEAIQGALREARALHRLGKVAESNMLYIEATKLQNETQDKKASRSRYRPSRFSRVG